MAPVQKTSDRIASAFADPGISATVVAPSAPKISRLVRNAVISASAISDSFT
jgi:hypothetical protein